MKRRGGGGGGGGGEEEEEEGGRGRGRRWRRRRREESSQATVAYIHRAAVAGDVSDGGRGGADDKVGTDERPGSQTRLRGEEMPPTTADQ